MAITVLTSNETGANSLIDINANFADLDTTKADLASPTFTGTPSLPTGTTAVTQTAGDNSAKLATTAYVDTALSNFVLDEDVVRVTTVSLSSADILGLYTTPKQLIAAPGAGKVIVVDEIVFSYTYGSSAYVSAGGRHVYFCYSGTTLNIFGTSTSSFVNTSDMTGSVSFIRKYGYITAAPVLLDNTALNILIPNGENYTTGNGTAKVFIKYRIITL